MQKAPPPPCIRAGHGLHPQLTHRGRSGRAGSRTRRGGAAGRGEQPAAPAAAAACRATTRRPEPTPEPQPVTERAPEPQPVAVTAPEPPAATTWTSGRGQSLWEIVQEGYGISDVASTVSLVDQVFDQNRSLTYPNLLNVGTELLLRAI